MKRALKCVTYECKQGKSTRIRDISNYFVEQNLASSTETDYAAAEILPQTGDISILIAGLSIVFAGSAFIVLHNKNI